MNNWYVKVLRVLHWTSKKHILLEETCCLNVQENSQERHTQVTQQQLQIVALSVTCYIISLQYIEIVLIIQGKMLTTNHSCNHV